MNEASPSQFAPRRGSSPAVGLDAASAAAVLERLDARLARIEARLDQSTQLTHDLPALAQTGLDAFDELARQHDLHGRSEAAMRLLERVSRPDTLERLTRAVELLDALPDQVDMAMDILDEVAATAEARGVDLSRLLPEGAELATSFVVAHQRAMHAPVREMGVFALLRAIREPELKRALAFLTELGRGLGAQLRDDDRRALPPGSRQLEE